MNRAHQQAGLTGSVREPAVAILWDMENCPVPSEVKADDVAGNVRKAIFQHPLIQGHVTWFSAYGDFSRFSRKVREGCQRTGVNLIDVPNGKKDASDKAILVDLFLFALDNRPPCTIFLISGDVDFSSALHKLGQRGYTVVLAVPSGVGVSPALFSAGKFVWDWPSLARGALNPTKNINVNRTNLDDNRVPETWSSRGMGDGRSADVSSANSSSAPPTNPSAARLRSTVRAPTPSSARSPDPPFSRDRRLPESIEVTGFTGNSSSAWGPSDESDFSADEQIVLKGNEMFRKANPFMDLGPSAISSRLDTGRKAINGSPSRRTSNASPARRNPTVNTARRTAAGSPVRRMSNASPARRMSNASPARRMSNASPARKNRSPAVGPIIPGKSSEDAVASGLGKLASVARAMSPAVRRLQPTQAVNLACLKDRLLRLLSSNSGKLEFTHVPAEYQNTFGEPLPDYGNDGEKLKSILEKWPDGFSIKGEGPSATLCLTRHGTRAAVKLKKDVKSGRNVSSEEARVSGGSKAQDEDLVDPADEIAGEQVLLGTSRAQSKDLIDLTDEVAGEQVLLGTSKAHGKDLVDPADEIAGEEVLLGRSTRSMQALSVELQFVEVRAFQRTNAQVYETSEQNEGSPDDWDLEPRGLSGDENNNVQDEELEFDESTVKEVVKLGNKKPVGSSILDMFKMELQELLISHAWQIKMSEFLKLYRQRYSRQLEYSKFGVEDLEALIGKVGDVATVREESGSKMLVGLSN